VVCALKRVKSLPYRRKIKANKMRDNREGYLELRAAYEREGLYFGVVRVCTPTEAAVFEFGVEHKGYLALRRILGARPFTTIPGLKHSFFFTGDHGRLKPDQEPVRINVRIEEGRNAKKFSFDCPSSLVANLRWFFELKDLREASALKRVPE
jgi:hypothetical protein